MRRTIKSIGAGLVGLAALVAGGGSGCTPEGNAFARDFTSSAIMGAAGAAIDEGIRQEIRSQYPENRPQTNVIVNNEPPRVVSVRRINDGGDSSAQRREIKVGDKFQRKKLEFFSYNYFEDSDGDGMISIDEFFGFGKRTFDSSKERISVCFINYSTEDTKIVHFRTWKDGKIIGETTDLCGPQKIKSRYTDNLNNPHRNPSAGDFMDKLGESGPGDYTITATVENGKTYMVDIKVVNDN